MAPRREPLSQPEETHLVVLATADRQPLFRNESWAQALVNILRRYQGEYDLHDFVILPDEVYLLLSPRAAVERSVQLIKGGFSFQARRAFAWKGDLWEGGFSDQPVRDHQEYAAHAAAIRRYAAGLGEGRRRFDGATGTLALAAEPARLRPPA